MKTIQQKTELVLCIIATMFSIAFLFDATAGELEPPGPPGPSMKPLNDLEPRRGIPPEPINITESGSYYLLDNIVVSDTNTTAITISASDVTIDLNGYTIRGPGKDVSGSNSGISAAPNVHRITVLNGSVCEWPNYGIELYGRSSRLKDLKCANNAWDGIRVGENSNVSGCCVSNNGDDGIEVGTNSLVNDCVAKNNGYGIYAPYRSTISNCTSDSNTTTGIIGDNYSTIRDCTANLNGSNGIASSTGSRIVNNNCGGNGDSGNEAGIIVFGAGSRVEGNNVANNYYGIYVDGTDNLIVKNNASGNTQMGFSAYYIVAGNMAGPISCSPLTETSPWANFTDFCGTGTIIIP